jgi:hypothetical protein
VHPPDFGNDWMPVFLMYGYGIFIGLIRARWIEACEQENRGLGLWEWATKSYQKPTSTCPSPRD